MDGEPIHCVSWGGCDWLEWRPWVLGSYGFVDDTPHVLSWWIICGRWRQAKRRRRKKEQARVTPGVVPLDWHDAHEGEAMGLPEQVFSPERAVDEIAQNRLLVARISWFCAPSVLDCVVQVVLVLFLFQTFFSKRRRIRIMNSFVGGVHRGSTFRGRVGLTPSWMAVTPKQYSERGGGLMLPNRCGNADVIGLVKNPSSSSSSSSSSQQQQDTKMKGEEEFVVAGGSSADQKRVKRKRNLLLESLNEMNDEERRKRVKREEQNLSRRSVPMHLLYHH